MRGRLVETSSRWAVVGLAGPLSYLLMLLFSPLSLTALASGDALAVTPLAQTMLAALVMCVGGFALSLTHPGSKLGDARTAVCACAGVLAALGAGLAALLYEPWVPVAVTVLLSASSTLQIGVGSQAAMRTPVPDMVVQALFALLIGCCVCTVAAAAFPVAAFGTALVGLVLVVTSAFLWLGAMGSTVPDPDPVLSLEGGLLPTLRALLCDWQPLAAGCVCALSLGFGWTQGTAAGESGIETSSLTGMVVGAAAVFLVVRHRTRNGGGSSGSLGGGGADGADGGNGGGADLSGTFSRLLFFSSALSVLAWALWSANGTLIPLSFVSSLSQVVFIGLLLAETLLTSRDLSRPAQLPRLGITLFLLAFIAGCACGGALAPATTGTLVATLYLLILCAMFVFETRRESPRRSPGDGEKEDAASQARRIGATAASALALDGVCRAIARDAGFTPREAEVLPMLIMGLSSTTIGARLFVSPQTVKSHTHRMYVKLGIHSHDELAELFAQRSAQLGSESDSPNLRQA